jgi:arylsulfatase A-like enzyme
MLMGSGNHFFVRGLAAALLIPLASCGDGVFSDPRPSIVLIVVDTLRADYLGCYGFEGGISPNIDALAEESFVSSTCYSQAPWTTPSVASMMTSMLPDLYGVNLPADAPRDHRLWRRQWNPAIPDSATTLAEVLCASGYRTAAFVANPFLIDGLGFDQGFEVFDTRRARAADRSAQRIFEDSAGWLGEALGARVPFFLYLHLMDVHGPYNAHQRDFFAVRDSPGLGPDHRLSNDEYDRIQPYLRKPDWAKQPEARFVRTWRARYAAGVRAADRQIGAFLDRLRTHPRWANTVVVLTSDHGEELFDHGNWDHGFSLYEHQLRVPLIVRSPGSERAGSRFEEPVRLLDLAPTLLGLVGIGSTPEIRGRDLLDGGGDAGPLPVFASGNKERPDEAAVIVGSEKLIFDLETGSHRLYDLETDPGETSDRWSETDETAVLLGHLLQHLRSSRLSSAAGSQPTIELTDEQLEQLRELGYVQ